MWIVKNETSEPVALPELRIELSAKEYLDLDAHGREKVEGVPSVVRALAKGALRTISKSGPEPVPSPAQAPVAPPKPQGAPQLLRDLVDRPPVPAGAPLFIPASNPTREEEAVGIREAFRRLSTRKGRKERDEEEPSSAEVAAIRQELERFRVRLLSDIQKLLDDYIRP